MKKLLALLAVVLCVVSCQTEPEGLDVNVGGEIDAIVNVTIPEAETRAANSGIGVFNNGVLDGNATMRYILQVYYKTVENGEAKYTASAERKVEYSDGKSVAFDVRLVPDRDYKFVVWADVVTSEADVDNHYITENLESITLNPNDTWVAMDESRDAFTATELIEKFNGAKAINITLKRPFAKLRVVTTDMEALSNINITPYKATATYTTSHRVAFNALTGKAASASLEDKAHTYTITTYANEWDNNGDSMGTMTIFSDYFFAADDDIVKFNLNVYEENGNLIKPNAFQTDINVKPNYLTTIKGNILTDGKGFQVTIEDGFANIDPINGNDPDYEYTTITSAVELLRAIGTSGNYVVMNDIKVTEADVLLASTLAATRSTTTTTTINLNGFAITISNNSNEPLVTLEEGEKVVFAGDGAIEKDPNTDGEFIDNSNDNTEVVFTGADYDEEVFTKDVIDYADEFIKAFNNETSYTLPADIIVKQSLTLPAGKSFELDLNGKTLSAINSISDKNNDGKLTSADNVVFIDVRGNLTVKNGTMTLKHTGDNYGWNACTELFYVGFNGTLNLDGVKAENLGGSDMTYVVDMVNATNITVNVANSTLKSNYIPFRVFNNGSGMNNVTINNSTLEGVSRAFWVHIYSNADNGGKGVKSATLNLDIYGNGNTFIASNPNRIIEFGFADEINFNAEGEQIVYDAARLKSIANYTNSGYSFKGETIKLAADIDLNNEEWTPIGSAYEDHGFMGNFDGNGKTIKNLKITNISLDSDGYAYAGLFGVTEGVDANNENYIKNLTIENVTINTEGHIVAAAIAYPYYTNIENVLVKGNVNIKGGDYTSGVLAYTRRCVNAKDITINANAGSVIEGASTIGGIISDIQMNGGLKANYSNFEATGLTIKGTQCVGGISGIICNQTLNGATVKNVVIVSDDARKGTLCGSFDGECTISNAVVENVTGADNFIGGLYKGTASEKASITINDVTYTYNNGWLVDGYKVLADGLLKLDNKYKVTNAAGLVALSGMTIKGSEVVTLGADIDLNGVAFNGLNAFNPENNNTFDGNGHTVSNWTNNSGASDMDFIKNWVGTIKNVKFDNCHLKTSGRSAIVAAKVYGNIEGVEVKNSSIEDSYWACGIIAGLYNAGSISNCAVTNSSVKSNGGTAAIVGVINESAGERNLTNCSVTGCTINNTGAYGADYSGGALVGMFNANATYCIEDCTVSDNTLLGGHVFEKYPANENVIEK